MSQVDPPPSPEELKKRREPKYIINPHEVKQTEDARIRSWFREIMRKNEHRLNSKWKDREIVWTDSIKPEDIDIQQVYPYPNLRYIVFREKALWSVMLISGGKMLAKSSFVKI